MAIFHQPAWNNDDLMFTCFDDFKSKRMVFTNEDRILSSEAK